MRPGAVALSMLIALPLGAQYETPVGQRPGPRVLRFEIPVDSSPRRLLPLRLPVRDSAWWVPLASTAVPGYGQLLLGQQRFVAYLATEGYALLSHLNAQSEARRERDRFRQLARGVAQASFDGSGSVGVWDQYEAMEKWIESGVLDRSRGIGEFSPEIAEGTFNAEQWKKARELAGWLPNVEPSHDSPLYRNAIAFYQAHAIGPDFRWSWKNAQLEWDLYRRSIEGYNDASRAAREWLALLAVNHALSTVDAFITLRLRGGVGAQSSSYVLTGRLPIADFGRFRSP